MDDKECKQLVEAYQKAIDTEDEKTFKEIMFKTWYVIHRITKKNRGLLPVPALMTSTQLSQVLETLFSWCFLLETSPNSVQSGNNILLTGVRGIGKTTIMQGLCSCICVLSKTIVAIYHDYEKIGNHVHIYDLINSWWKVFSPNDHIQIDPHDCLQSTFEKDKSVVVCADEFQGLYERQSNEQIEKAKQILHDLYLVGKSYGAVAIISGSSSNVRDLAFQRNGLGKGYQNFNHTVFQERRLEPLRTQQDFKDFLLRLPSPLCNYDPEEVFSATGGIGLVGRMIMSFTSGFKNRNRFGNTFNLDPILEVAMRELVTLNTHDDSTSQFDMWNMIGINHTDLAKIANISAQDPHSKILEWVDKGFLFETPDPVYYTFLCPSDYHFLRNLFSSCSMSLHIATLSVFIGFPDNGSAGTILQKHILSKINTCFFRPVSTQSIYYYYYHAEPISFSQKELKQTTFVFEKWRSQTPYNVICDLKVDNGLDGVLFEFKEHKICNVHMYQMKFGKLGKELKLGTNNASADPSMYYTAILKNMRNGYDKLLPNLHLILSDYKFVPKTFTLITNKLCHIDVQNFITNPESVPSIFNEYFNNDFRPILLYPTKDQVYDLFDDSVKDILKNHCQIDSF